MPADKRKKPSTEEDDFKKQLQAYVKRIGSLGGKKRSQNLTPERRQEIARKAVLTRWAKAKRKKKAEE